MKYMFSSCLFKSFLRDPTGDLPFEEDPASKDVIHILEASVSRTILVKSVFSQV